MSSVEDLGPVVLTGKTHHGSAIILLITGLVLVGMGGIFLIQNEETRPPLFVPILLLLAGISALGLAGLLRWGRRGVRTVHEKGLQCRVGNQVTTMKIDEADQVAYFVIHLFVNGVYTATDEKLGLKSDRPDGRSVYFQRRYRDPHQNQGPSPAHRLVQPVIARIAERNKQRVARGESVSWFPGATINDWGVELPNGLGGKIAIRWDELETPEIENGVCKIRKVGRSAPVARVNTFQMNFFPGLAVVESRRRGSLPGR